MKRYFVELLEKVSGFEVLKEWRKVHLLGMAELRGRFARSRLGQLWVSLSMLFNICIVGLVWSVIWKMPVAKYLPYVGMGHIIFSFVSQTINESSGIYVTNARLYINQPLSLSISVFAHVYKNVIVMLYNLPTFVLLFVLSPYTSMHINGYFFLGIILTFCFVIVTSYMLSIICVRFRDLIQIVGVLMQASFLVTPVMWEVSMVPQDLLKYVYLNPFACIVESLRGPFFNTVPPLYAYVSLGLWSLAIFLMSCLIYKRFSRNLVFWM